MSQPCAASAGLASNVFQSFRKLSYAAITRQQPIPFLTSTRIAYQTGVSISRFDPAARRCFRTYSPVYNSIPQSHAEENASNPPGTSEPSATETPTTEIPATQSESTQGNEPTTQPPQGEKQVKPRRHRKDKPAETKPTSQKPLIRYQKSKDPDNPKFKEMQGWRIQKEALKAKFKDGWAPRKKLSPDDLERVRHLHSQDPEKYSTPNLADQFKISPEAIRRILKSKWRPDEKQMAKRRENWEKRRSKIWNQMSEIGLRPKRKSLSPYSDAAALDKKSKPES